MTEAKTSKNIIDTERYKYARVTHNDGRRNVHSKDNGDPIAVALRGSTTEDLCNVLRENEMWDNRYENYSTSMTAGRFRMTAGQAIRYRWLRGTETKIKGNIIPAPPKAPEAEAPAA